jgi:tetratricopeptide (TPR) repeat protein
MLCQSITNFYSELLQTTLEHYRQGCVKPIEITSEIYNNLAEQKLQTLIVTRLPLTDQRLIARFGSARYRGLIAARQGNLMAAERAFTEARVPLKLGKLSPAGSLLYKSLLEQSESYLDYRRGDFEQARNRTLEAIENDVVLEEEYRYEILFLHRIHLVHNLVRIDARCMCFKRAIELACQILSYLEGTSEVLPIPGYWGYERMASQSPELVAAMFAAVTSEVALILAGQNRQLVGDLFAVISAHMQLQANGISIPNRDSYSSAPTTVDRVPHSVTQGMFYPQKNRCNCHPRAHAWLLIKQAFVNKDFATFLERASDFLALGRADTPLLWYATVIDLVALCDELPIPDSDLVRQEVASEATTWENLPQKFFPLLGVCPKTEGA